MSHASGGESEMVEMDILNLLLQFLCIILIVLLYRSFDADRPDE